MVTSKKWQSLQDWMAKLNIVDSDIIEQFIIGSGSGGQNLHKTANCVLLIHAKSNTQIKCQHSRSRETSRYIARQRLCEKIDEQQHDIRSKRQQQIAKLRKQKQKRKKRAVDKHNKQYKSKIKQSRKSPPQNNPPQVLTKTAHDK
jgi:protein subunit release factor B